MKTDAAVKELTEVIRQFGIRVRRERGNFTSGLCTVRSEPTILLNKHHSPDVHLTVLLDHIVTLPIDTVFVKPALREIIDGAMPAEKTASTAAGEQASDEVGENEPAPEESEG